MKVSVIVPVYNVENYICRCLESIINQTLKDMEIIIVDDGSTDNSINKIQLLVNANKNIKIIHQLNGGLSSARNKGLKHAVGEYVIFVDSDDWIEDDFLEVLYNTAKREDLDIVCGGHQKVYAGKPKEIIKREKKLYDLGVVSGSELLLKQLEIKDYRVEVWDDLFKREFLLDNNLYFAEGVLHEDELYTPSTLMVARRVKVIDHQGYMYRQRENSIMNQPVGLKNIAGYKYTLDCFLSNFDKSINEYDKKIYSKLCSHLFNLYMWKLTKMEGDIYLPFKNLPRKGIVRTIKYDYRYNLGQKIRLFMIVYTPHLYYKRLLRKYKN